MTQLESKSQAVSKTGPDDKFIFYALEIFARVMLVVLALLAPINLLTNDVRIYWDRARDISPNYLPYRDFTWEYPPLTVLPLLLLPLSGRGSEGFHLLFLPLMVGLEYGSLCLIRRARPEHFMAVTKFWSLTVVPLSLLAWFRFDYMSVFFATIALIALERKKSLVLPVLLGFLSKLWPIFFAVGLFAQRRFKETAYVIAACVAATAVWWALTPDGFHTFLKFRQGEGFQVESLPGAVILASGRHSVYTFGALNVSDNPVHFLQYVMNGLSLLGPAVIAVFALRSKHRNDVALVAGTIAFVLCVNRLLSPQFIVWLAPFVVWMWPKERRLGLIYALLAWLTLGVILFYHAIIRNNLLLDLLLNARNIVLVWFTFELLHAAFKPKQDPVELAPSLQNR